MATRSRCPGRVVLVPGCILALTLLSSQALASNTWTVRKDGTGQFTTINAAKAAATTGDIIEVGPGTYPEEIDFSYAVTLHSTAGAASTILDGEQVRRLLIFRAGTGSVVDGFTIRNGTQVSAGGGLRVQLTATATVKNCVFENNYSEFDGAAVICRDTGSRMDVQDCVFKNNFAEHRGGAGVVVMNGTATFTRCTFDGNDSGEVAALGFNTGSVCTVTDCLFTRNGSDISCIYGEASNVTVIGNTFVNNAAIGATIHIFGCNVVFKRNILADDTNAIAWNELSNTSEDRTCNIYWHNLRATTSGTLKPGEVAADPLFCDAGNGVYTVSTGSPAAPANSPCGELIGAFPTACGVIVPPPPPHAPTIISILDVPNDQGRQVRIRFNKSDYDASGKPVTITGYAIYRAQGAFMLAKLASAPRHVSDGKVMIDGWDYIATVPARGDDIYQYVAPTLCDKPKGGDPCWSTFFVSALTPAPLTYYDSEPDSGWSEDNLAPDPPTSFAANISPAGADLTWVKSRASDIDHYRIYKARGGWPLPIDHNLAQSTTATEWMDPAGAAGVHYIITAVDVNGNEGDAVEAVIAQGSGGPIPQQFALGQNSPNPFNPTTRIQFEVPAGGGMVNIAIYDVAGKRVRTLLSETRAGGTWSVMWDGRADSGNQVTSGVYFCKMTAAGFTQTRRMVMVK